MKTATKLWVGITVLVVLTPLGLIVPEYCRAGAAWGEWGGEEIQKLVGYIPAGFEKLSSLWNAPLPDYAFKGWDGKTLSALGLAYAVSGVAGSAITVGIVFLFGKMLTGRRRDQ